MIHRPYVLKELCTGRGGNAACRAGHRDGRSVHVNPGMRNPHTEPLLVMPTYHYATVADGMTAIERAELTAPMVRNDRQLAAFRRAGRPHFLPVGWIDPTRR